MVDLPVGQRDCRDSRATQGASRLQLRRGMDLCQDVGGGVAQRPALAVAAYRDGGLTTGQRPQRSGAQACAVAAVAIPLREAAARRRPENLDAHKNGAWPACVARRRAKQLSRGDIHRDFEAEADVLKARCGPFHCNLRSCLRRARLAYRGLREQAYYLGPGRLRSIGQCVAGGTEDFDPRHEAIQQIADRNHHANIAAASQNAERVTYGTTTAEVSVAQAICRKLCSDEVAPL